MITVGITGSYGSGKTTVAGMFKRLGAKVVDADTIYRSLLRRDNRIRGKLRDIFGKDIILSGGRIDRKKIREVVFRDRDKLKRLNTITHPRVIREIDKRLKKFSGKFVIMIDAALLVESGYYRKMDRVIVVKSNRKKQIHRLARYKGVKYREALDIIRSQAPLKKKLAIADFIIDNSGSIKNTKRQVARIWKKLKAGV